MNETLVRTATGEMVSSARELFAREIYNAVYDAVRPLATFEYDRDPRATFGVEDFCAYFATEAYKSALRKG